MTAEAPLDLITLGRISADIYPLQDGVPLEDVQTFQKYVGGSATNVAIAAARYGRRTAVITGVGDDPFGRFCRREVGRLGVDNRYVFTDPDNPTPLAFCEIFPPDRFPLYFRREPKAPDLNVRADRLDLPAISAARVFWATVTGLSQQPSRDAHHAAWRARGRKPYTVLDLDYRSMFWASTGDARREVADALDYVTVAIGNLDEWEVAVGETEPGRATDALLDRGLDLVVVKRGPRGVLARTRSETVELPPVAVPVVNGLGAGDGFGGALVHGLLSGWGLSEALRFANAAGAIVATRRECSMAMPDAREVRSLLARRAETGM